MNLGTAVSVTVPVSPRARRAAPSRDREADLVLALQLGDSAALAHALAMHGNELRKSGQPAALDVLERAVITAAPSPGRGAALALLARAAASAGNAARLTAAVASCHDLIQRHGPAGPLSCPFTVRKIQLRGLLDLGNPARAIALAQTTPPGPAPAPQWEIIERITFAASCSAQATTIPFRHAGARCPRDGTEMKHGTVGGLSTWWCSLEQAWPPDGLSRPAGAG